MGEFRPGDTTYYLLGLDGLGQQQNGQWSCFGFDGLGSVRETFDTLGNVSYAASYDPYGVPFEQAGVTAPTFGFTGEQTDRSALVYLRARYMNPALGMFLTRDPFPGTLDMVMSRNGYSYVHGNPVNDAVGELLFVNGYNYANGNPVNLVDLNGMCAQPTQWWNPVDANCYYSAVGLAQRFSQGNPQAYNAWYEFELYPVEWSKNLS